MKQFFMEMAERAIKTSAQSAIAIISTAHFISDIDWVHCLSAISLATLLSILMSFSSFNFGDKGTASIIKIKKTTKDNE
ncbi:MAG: holin [Oscillospiraceae bacterium]|jgi:hypothetical protein|nr:holin [Oscillospiraceae bacterium]